MEPISENKTEIDILMEQRAGFTTPSTQKKIIERRLEIEDKKYDDNWRTCCCVNTTDKRIITFFTQIFIIIGVMIFAIYQLATNDTCETQQSYLSLLTLMLGIALPNPKHGK